MTVFGLVAVAGNAASLSLLARGQAVSLNVRSAYLEVLGDFLGHRHHRVPTRRPTGEPGYRLLSLPHTSVICTPDVIEPPSR